jgi:hypothetical protein
LQHRWYYKEQKATTSSVRRLLEIARPWLKVFKLAEIIWSELKVCLQIHLLAAAVFV